MYRTTHWKIVPSFPFDALCWLNVLTGDPFYVRYYPEDYATFQQRLTPAATRALKNLKTKVKDEKHVIISAFLCMVFSAANDQTLADLLRTVEESSRMYEVFKQSQYYQEERWQIYEAIRPELKVLLLFLQEVGFEAYWHTTILPRVEQRISMLQDELSRFNVIVEDEALLGIPFPSDEITVCVLNYARPHGIKVLGTRFITDTSYPVSVTVKTAAHELFHPPYNQHHAPVQACISELKEDPFLMETFVNHNPDYGYNTFQGLIEEGCVRALDQLVSEKLGIAKDARERWRTEDEGLHVFAACLYAIMQEERFNEQGEVFEAFFVRMIRSKLQPGTLKQIYTTFMQGA